jgi:hypothetical protein
MKAHVCVEKGCLVAWPPSGALPEGDREENFSADE